MFYAIVPEPTPVFVVHPNEAQIDAQATAVLIERLRQHFLHEIALVTWDQNGQFRGYGYRMSENVATDEDLQWREFELPAEPDLPF